MLAANEIMLVIGLISEYHCTVKHNRIYLFPAPLQPPLPALGGVTMAVSAPAGAGSATKFKGSLRRSLRVLAFSFSKGLMLNFFCMCGTLGIAYSTEPIQGRLRKLRGSTSFFRTYFTR